MSYCPPDSDWERLPWLADRPAPAPAWRRREAWLLLIAAVSLDATASYSAGARTARQKFATIAQGGQDLPAVSMGGLEARRIAQRLADAEYLGWQRERPTAPD